MSPTDPTSGPFGADTDEAVSALLDGELDAFARDHGTTGPDARGRLDAWAGLDARRRELEAARAAIAAPVPELDEVTRRRLVRTAVDAGPAAPASAPSRRTASWRVIGAVAATVIILVGVGLTMATTGGDGPSHQDASSSASDASPRRGDLGDVGDVTSPAALRALVEGRDVEGGESTAEGGSADESPAPGAPPAADSSARSRFDAGLTRSPPECARQVAGDRELAFVATGTFRDIPVTIVGVSEGGRTIALVVASDDCTDVLASLSR